MVKKYGVLLSLITILLMMPAGVFAGNQKEILMVIAAKDFKDNELFEPKTIFEIYGAKVTVASTTTDIAVGMDGFNFKPDLKITDVIAKNYDAIVISGGTGAQALFDDPDLRQLVLEFNKRGKTVAAMCISPVILGNAGLLKGKNATIFPWDAMVDKLKETGAIYTDQEVVVSGNIITGRDPDAAKAFGLAISKALGIKSK